MVFPANFPSQIKQIGEVPKSLELVEGEHLLVNNDPQRLT
jgi:hypothetical protein